MDIRQYIQEGFNLKLRYYFLGTAIYGGYTIFQVKKVPTRDYITINPSTVGEFFVKRRT